MSKVISKKSKPAVSKASSVSKKTTPAVSKASKVNSKKTTPATHKASIDLKKRSGVAGLALEEREKIDSLVKDVENLKKV